MCDVMSVKARGSKRGRGGIAGVKSGLITVTDSMSVKRRMTSMKEELYANCHMGKQKEFRTRARRKQ